MSIYSYLVLQVLKAFLKFLKDKDDFRNHACKLRACSWIQHGSTMSMGLVFGNLDGSDPLAVS